MTEKYFCHSYSNMSKEVLLENLQKYHDQCKDRFFNPSIDLDISLENSEISISGIKNNFSSHAMGQLLNKLGIPKLFFDKNPANLKYQIFSHWRKKNNTNFLFRFNDKGTIRAVLSSMYSTMDDHQLIPIILDSIKDNYRIYSFDYDNDFTRLMIEFTDTVTEHNNATMSAGMMVTNSETGMSSIWIEPVVRQGHYLFVNRNSVIGQGTPCRLVHRGEIYPEKVTTLVNQVRDIAQVGIVQLAEAKDENIEIENIVEAAKQVSSRFSKLLADEWEKKEYIKKLEATRRILDLAKELPLFQRAAAEQSAGKMVGLFNNYKSRIQRIAEQL